MTDKEKLEAVRAEIEKRISRNIKYKKFEDVPEKKHQLIIEGQLLGELKHFIDSIQEEPTPHRPKVREATGKLKELLDNMDEKALAKTRKEMMEEPSIPDIVDEHWFEMLGKEPVSKEKEDNVTKVFSAALAIAANEKNILYDSDGGKFRLTEEGKKELEAIMRQDFEIEEPVSDDLEEAAISYVDSFLNGDLGFNPNLLRKEACSIGDVEKELNMVFKAGAKWGKNQAKVEIQAQSMALAHGCYEEPVSGDLEQASEEYAYKNWQSDDYHEGASEGLEFDPIGHTQKTFKAGANWQKQIDKKDEDEMLLISYMDGVEKGKKQMREQMLKDATEVTVHIEAGNYPYIPQIELYDYDKDIPLAKEGDKYKVILIKED